MARGIAALLVAPALLFVVVGALLGAGVGIAAALAGFVIVYNSLLGLQFHSFETY